MSGSATRHRRPGAAPRRRRAAALTLASVALALPATATADDDADPAEELADTTPEPAPEPLVEPDETDPTTTAPPTTTPGDTTGDDDANGDDTATGDDDANADGSTADPGPDNDSPGAGEATSPDTVGDGAEPSPTTTVPVIRPTTNGIDVSSIPVQLQHVLATIRYLESRNTYDIAPNRATASGAYQFIDSTWDGFGGYPSAYLAPPAVQDERALLDVNRFLERFDGDISMVPVMWYYPRAVRQPELMDVVPKPEHGNKLTIREYQTRWLGVFAELSGQWIQPSTPGIDPTRSLGLPPVVPATRAAFVGPDGDQTDPETTVALTFPVLGPSRMASLECATEQRTDGESTVVIRDGDESIEITAARERSAAERAGLCSERAPGVVFGVKLQPVLAAADGIVTEVVDDPGGDEPISVTITSPDGTSIHYRGFNDDRPGTEDGAAPDHLRLSSLIQVGGIVRAGQVIGFMGDSDPLPPDIRADVPTDSTQRLDPDATAPHIRLTITDRFGRPVDAVGPLLDARARETCRIGIGGWSIPPASDVFDPVTIETTDIHDEIDSEWIVTETGQVLATGWAAMINPVELCGVVPNEPYGPGAGGAIDWLAHWVEPYELPTELWVELALRDESTPEGPVLPG